MSVIYATSFALEQLNGTHDFSSDTFKLALFSDAAALSAATTAYSVSGEVSNGNGYTTGGETMVLSSGYPQTEGDHAVARFDDVSWNMTAPTQVAYGLMYNTSKSDKAVMIFSFGTGRRFTGTFAITFPASQPALIKSRS